MKLRKMMPLKNMRGRVVSLLNFRNGVGFWLIIGAIILCVSMWWNRHIQRAIPSYQSVDFAYAAPQLGTYTKAAALPLLIPIQVPERATQIIVTFKYRVSPTFRSAWLVIPTQQPVGGSKILIDHELLRNYPMQSIYGKGVSLYQKKLIYTSMDEFLKSSHSNEIVVADSYLLSWYASQSGQLQQFTPFESYTTTGSLPDFIWTTFTKPRIFPDGWNEFNRGMTIAKPIRDKDGITTLQLMSDNPNETMDITEPVIRFK